MVRDIQTGEEQWGLMSYLFRVNYSYKDRYMFTASGRYDGSSRLSDGNKWAFSRLWQLHGELLRKIL